MSDYSNLCIQASKYIIETTDYLRETYHFESRVITYFPAVDSDTIPCLGIELIRFNPTVFAYRLGVHIVECGNTTNDMSDELLEFLLNIEIKSDSDDDCGGDIVYFPTIRLSPSDAKIVFDSFKTQLQQA
jgi:hypothetical protein